MGDQNGFGVELPSFAWNNCRKSGLGGFPCTLLSLSSLQLLCGRAGGVRQLGRQLLNGVHFDENKKKSFVIVL